MVSLEEFGLSHYEIKVFHELLRNGVLSARELSNKSQVPYGRIYDVLNSLEYRSLIKKQASRPAKYMAVEPRFALKKLIQYKKKEIDSLTQKAKKLEKELNIIYRKPMNESLFWSIALGPERTQLRTEKLEEVNSELLMYIEPYQDGSFAKKDEVLQVMQSLKNLIKKGVLIKILMGYTNKEHINEIVSLSEPYKEYLEKIQIKLINNMSIPFDIIDNEKVHIKVRNPAKPDEFFASIYFWQKSFAEELREKFEEMWMKGKNLTVG